jgi:putative mycofactocin binding protein MftB
VSFACPRFDSSARYQLDDNVALRPEPFGALAYHYGSRRLTFLRSKLLADVVAGLGEFESVESALSARVPVTEQASYRRALAQLASSEFIHAC